MEDWSSAIRSEGFASLAISKLYGSWPQWPSPHGKRGRMV
ncbi:hypothetical protein SynPROS71_00317 [Synechococcus sp. PROS-7-1]|nr:hypothetical protein SynPROS71_00317 [Synechococcus sp. PROS-7-1]